MSPPKTVILITGANTGLGLATARLLLLQPPTPGAPHKHIILTSRHLPAATAALSTLLPPTPNPNPNNNNATTASALALDVTDPSSVSAAVDRIRTDHGHLSILINNAGVSPKLPTRRADAAVAMGTNVVGCVGVTEAFLELLRSAAPAPAVTAAAPAAARRIIYLSSGLGSLGLASDPTDPYHGLDVVAYRASKAAVNMVAVQQAKTLGREGVLVFAVDPGFRATGLSGDAAAAKARGAGDPEGGAQVVVDVVEGRRDADVGKLVHEGGVHPW